jgi:hypothetical protein
MTELFFKGKDLERAVSAIERAILRNSPSYDKDTFRIETRKIVTVEGVKHEIDIWVEVDLGKGYRSVFIFECKNQTEKVDKNDIIVFSEKIATLQAQHGFYVARSFTRYAEAQAARDPRMTLLPVTELPVEQIPVPFNFHFVGREDPPHADVKMRQAGADHPTNEVHLDLDSADVVRGGQQIDFKGYRTAWVDDAVEEHTRAFPSTHFAEGVYDLETHVQRTFGEGELFVDRRPISSIELLITYRLRVIRPPLVSHYEVATRGRSLSLAPAQIGEGVELQASFVVLDP